MLNAVRRLVIGGPLASSQARLERLAIPLAFVILSSNALSSVAYASEEILIAFQRDGVLSLLALRYALFLTIALVTLTFVVVFSYQQVVRVYPQGGGAYLVAKENLGTPMGLVASAGLLIDYILTVSVSVTAGVAAIGSAVPAVADHRVVFSVLFVLALTILNMRGVRESARVLALPVYLFIGSFLVMIAVGLLRYTVKGEPAVMDLGEVSVAVQGLGILLVLRAFASGSVALTGIEAVSNATGVFKAPETRNARVTLILMGALLGTMFLGVTLLAYLFHIGPVKDQTLISQVAKASLGVNVFYYVVLLSTTLILLVAANTSYSAFPRLSALMAHDGFLPRPMGNLGDRLVYFNGVLVLSFLSILLILFVGGDTHRLIPIYAIGVFIGFTLTQTGMVAHWWRRREKGWLRGLIINGLGGVVIATVLLEITVVKFNQVPGAWMVLVTIPLLMVLFFAIRNHYTAVAEALSLDRPVADTPLVTGTVAILPVGAVHRAVLPALDYAKAIALNVQAVHVAVDEEEARSVQIRWVRLHSGVPLTLIPSPYRAVVQPLLQYIQQVARDHPSERIVVVVPEFVPRRMWQQLLHNQTALILKGALLFQRRIIVVSVPYHLPR